MPPKGKKGKGKGKKPKKEELDEAARLQEELARQEAEELKRLQEEEEKRKAEEARILAYETQTREEQFKELQRYIEDIQTLFKKNLADVWEKNRWDDYLYKTKEMDTLDVKVVNSYMSDWEEDEDDDVEKMFQTIKECLKIKEDIASGMAVYPYEDLTMRTSWNEIIDNLEILIYKKLDYVSFMILKDSRQRLDEFTQNMEYSTEDEESSVTLCLWANLHRAARRRGADMGRYGFRAPAAMVVQDCTARLLHTTEFDGLWKRLKQLEDEYAEMISKIPIENVPEKTESITDISLGNTDTAESLDGATTVTEGDGVDPKENIQENEILESEATELPTDRKKSTGEIGSDIDSEINPVIETELGNPEPESEITEDYSLVHTLVTDERDNVKKEDENYEILKLVSLREYIPIGGILHFDMFKVPQLTFKKKGISYVYREEPLLQPLDREAESYSEVEKALDVSQESKSNIQQNKLAKDSKVERPEEGEEVPAVEEKAAEETPSEAEKEHLEENAAVAEEEVDRDKFFIKMPIPHKVMIFKDPIPACFNPDNNCFTTEGISNTQYDPVTRQIKFTPDQYGIFGLFQKKYLNFPFKDWSLNGGGEIIKLSLTGQHTEILIEVSNEGCRVESINDLPFTEMSESWLTPDRVNEKLLSIGINIFAERAAQNFIGKAFKLKKLEYEIYEHMALLSQQCSFAKSKWNSLQSSDEFVLQFSVSDQTKEEKKPYLVFINQERAVSLKCKEDVEKFSTEAEQSEKFSSNLFHLILNNSQISSPDINKIYACMKNVSSLLQQCCILSCS